MIVISGALVLVALVLLVIGVVSPELNYVYASIVVSLASGIFLLVGILQRRRTGAPAETAPAAAGSKPGGAADGDVAPVTAVLPAGSSRSARRQEPAPGSVAIAPAEPEAPEADEADELPEDDDLAGYVLVVPGRPRYHVDGCRYVSGKDVEELDVRDARDEGFTACGVCRPDEALEDAYYDDDEDDQARPPEQEPEEREPAAQNAADQDGEYDDGKYDDGEYDDGDYDDGAYGEQHDGLDAADVPVVEPVPVPVERPARKAPAAGARPATKAPERPAAAAGVAAGTSAETAARGAAKAPAQVRAGASVRIPTTSATSQPKAASRAAVGRTSEPAGTPAPEDADEGPAVIVIPDRGKFHTPECRYVRGVPGASELSRSEATGQSYEACGLCRP